MEQFNKKIVIRPGLQLKGLTLIFLIIISSRFASLTSNFNRKFRFHTKNLNGEFEIYVIVKCLTFNEAQKTILYFWYIIVVCA